MKTAVCHAQRHQYQGRRSILRWKRSLSAIDLVTIVKCGVHMRHMKSKNRGKRSWPSPNKTKVHVLFAHPPVLC